MLVFFYLLKNVQSEKKILQSKRNTSIKVSEIQDWDLTILFTKTLLTGADCDPEEGSIMVLVTTALRPPKLNCPEVKLHSHGHGMSILKCFDIFKKATKPKDMGLMK